MRAPSLRDKPSGAVLAALAAEVKEPEALASRCRAMAAREAAAGAEAFAMARAALIARYGPGDDGFLLRALAAEIRAGALDEGSLARGTLAALLWAITQQKLCESNPDYLAAPLTPA